MLSVICHFLMDENKVVGCSQPLEPRIYGDANGKVSNDGLNEVPSSHGEMATERCFTTE